MDSYSYKVWPHTSGLWTWSTYIFRLKDMAYHLVLLLCLWCPGRSFNTVLGGCAWHPASRHQDHNVPNVCDVGYSTECVVHHRLLLAKSTKVSHVEDKINLWTSAQLYPLMNLKVSLSSSVLWRRHVAVFLRGCCVWLGVLIYCGFIVGLSCKYDYNLNGRS